MDLKNTHSALSRFGDLYLAKAKKRLKDEGHYASGDLDRSLDFDVAGTTLEVTMLKHGLAVEGGADGFRGGSTGDFSSMVENLAQWAKYKRIRPTDRDSRGRFKKMDNLAYKRLGFALSRSILKKGIIKKYNYGGSRIFEEVYDELMPKYSAELLNAYGRDIENELKILLKTKE